MKLINLWGGPGTGKSTTAAGLFSLMKLKGYDVELVPEYAKDLTWEGHHNKLADQNYVFAKQHRRIARLVEHDLDYVITDSPLLFTIYYMPED